METNSECGGRIIAPYGIIERVITCRKMGAADVKDAFHMLSDFLRVDEHYLASSQAYGDLGLAGLNNALDLFLEHPELGFVWMAYDEDGCAGICVVCYAISTSMGSVVAKLDDVSVKPDRRGKGTGTEMLEHLKEQLRKEAVTRIDVAVHLQNPEARRFYEKGGFVALNEERLSCLI
ncbi:MAG TPA: GNAT family N-acetyltransferase [Pyrinomonadaceae bacterium]|nr:GNAT family N-acetyltransferase [Pyrinomonadaceae bacterium]